MPLPRAYRSPSAVVGALVARPARSSARAALSMFAMARFPSWHEYSMIRSVGFMVSGIAHGPEHGTTVCQLHMRRFKENERLTLEPWRAKAFPVIKDLVVDRSAFDRIIQAGGYTSINAGGPQDANAILIPKVAADKAMDSAACIGCGACVAACKNASAALFTSAKVSHLALLPQGQPERASRVVAMVERHDAEGFGSCSNEGECEAVCPKEIPITNIARMNREYLKAMLVGRD